MGQHPYLLALNIKAAERPTIDRATRPYDIRAGQLAYHPCPKGCDTPGYIGALKGGNDPNQLAILAQQHRIWQGPDRPMPAASHYRRAHDTGF